jgi:transposase
MMFLLTGGQVSDYKQALALLEGRKAKAVLADRGYDADYIVQAIEVMGGKVVIPPKRNRKVQRDYDKGLYRERNLVERLFNKLKNFRRVATRYEKLDMTFLSFAFVSASCIWLK